MANQIKQKRLASIIERDLSDIIQYDVKDPDASLATVTGVEVSRDHSYATIYVTFLGDAKSEKLGMKALERGKGFIRSQLAQMLDIRRTPELIFKVDHSMENGRHIDEIIDQIHQMDAKKNIDVKEETSSS